MALTDDQIIAIGVQAAREGNVEVCALCAYALDGVVPSWVLDAPTMTQAEAREACAELRHVCPTPVGG